MRRTIVLMTVVLVFASAAHAALPTGVNGVGANFYCYTGGTWQAPDYALMANAGIKVVNTQMYWNGIETTTPGVYDFSTMDTIYTGCVSQGMRPLYTLIFYNDLYSHDVTSPSFLTGYTNFAVAAVKHMKQKGGAAMFEIWTEPNMPHYWPGTPTDYVNMLKVVVPAMRAEDPNATIIAAGPNTPGGAAWQLIQPYCQQGVLDLVDAIDIHGYTDDGNASPPEVNAGHWTALQNIIKSYNGGQPFPIVCAEFGYPIGGNILNLTEQQQADYVVRGNLVNLSQGIASTCDYCWTGDWWDPVEGVTQDNFRMTTPDYEPREVYNAIQELTRSLRGTTFTAKLPSPIPSWMTWMHPENDWLLEFTSPNGQKTLAAWTTGSPRTLDIPGWGILDLTNTPQYVNPVPEPQTIVLLAAALMCVCAYRKWLPP